MAIIISCIYLSLSLLFSMWFLRNLIIISLSSVNTSFVKIWCSLVFLFLHSTSTYSRWRCSFRQFWPCLDVHPRVLTGQFSTGCTGFLAPWVTFCPVSYWEEVQKWICCPLFFTSSSLHQALFAVFSDWQFVTHSLTNCLAMKLLGWSARGLFLFSSFMPCICEFRHLLGSGSLR